MLHEWALTFGDEGFRSEKSHDVHYCQDDLRMKKLIEMGKDLRTAKEVGVKAVLGKRHRFGQGNEKVLLRHHDGTDAQGIALSARDLQASHFSINVSSLLSSSLRLYILISAFNAFYHDILQDVHWIDEQQKNHQISVTQSQ